MDYYSTFDWDNYCVSINGPVAISSLPKIVGRVVINRVQKYSKWLICLLKIFLPLRVAADTPGNDRDELLLSQEFLKRCREIYSVPIKALETTVHEFPVKHLNIVDPLKENNNLGRSVSKGI